MDAEKGQEVQVDQNVSKFQKLKTWLAPKKLLVGCVLLVCMLAVMFGIGILSAQYGKPTSPVLQSMLTQGYSTVGGSLGW